MEQKAVERHETSNNGISSFVTVMEDDKCSREIGVCTAMPSPL